MKIPFIYFILFVFCHPSIHAQSFKENVRITYRALERLSMEQSKPGDIRQILSIGENTSSYYYEYDSIKASFSHINNNRVYKNRPQEGKLTFVSHLDSYYTEDIPDFQWAMLEGDTTICEYPCMKARTTFRGRTWTVWYTIDLPYSDGPWKLSGLPGLIMKADDEKGDFSFTAIKVAKGTNREIPLDIFNSRKSTAQEYAEDAIEQMCDPIGFIQRTTNVKIKIDFGNNPELAPKPQTACLMEYFEKTKK